MKKILGSLLLTALVGVVGIKATTSFFSDTETSPGNTFQAGKLDLKVDYSSTYNGNASNSWELTDLTNQKFFDLADVKPGDTGEGTVSLHVSDNNAWGCVTITPTANDDTSSTEPELAAGDATNSADLFDGELAQNMVFTIWADTCAVNATPGDNIYQANCDKPLTSGPGPLIPVSFALADSTHPNIFTDNGALTGNTDYYIGTGWALPGIVGNIVQSDNYKADISFYTDQERNNSKFVCPSTKPRISFFDDFNDGNADGWISGTNCSSPGWCRFGNYRVVDNQVTNDEGGDGQMILAQDYPMTSHTVEAKVLWHDNGYAGLAVWYLNDDNWVTIGYPGNNHIGVTERWCYSALPCARDENVISTAYPHVFTTRVWQTMKVVANCLTGELAVYLDGEYLFTHTVGPSTHREGLSGFMSGNAGGSFDNFKLTSN